jgi:hypothetical protein
MRKMSTFDLTASLERAARRFGTHRRSRSDAGKSRLELAVDRRLTALLQTQERLPTRDIMRELRTSCRRARLRAPSRATIYNAIGRCPAPRYRVLELPDYIQVALFNVDPEAEIDGSQVAFYAFNHGDVRAACWAAGLPWLALHHAARLRGWRPKSRGLLVAVMHRRRIP